MLGAPRSTADPYVKIYGDPTTADRAARRAAILGENGIRTPAGTQIGDQPRVVFVRIAGAEGRQIFAHALARYRHGDEDGITVLLTATLLGLNRIHAIGGEGLSLDPYDPWHRIKPRAPLLEPEERDFVARLEDAFRRAAPAVSRRDATLHGDFHVGQLLFVEDDVKDRPPWIVDLDDMAVGPPEADLANFIAHLATSGDLWPGDPAAFFDAFSDPVVRIYRAVAGVDCAPDALRLYGAASLLRRLLKLREKGIAKPVSDAILRAGRALIDP